MGALACLSRGMRIQRIQGPGHVAPVALGVSPSRGSFGQGLVTP